MKGGVDKGNAKKRTVLVFEAISRNARGEGVARTAEGMRDGEGVSARRGKETAATSFSPWDTHADSQVGLQRGVGGARSRSECQITAGSRQGCASAGCPPWQRCSILTRASVSKMKGFPCAVFLIIW